MILRSSSLAATAVSASTIPITSKRCHSSMAPVRRPERRPYHPQPRGDGATEQRYESWRIAGWSAIVVFLIVLGYASRAQGATRRRTPSSLRHGRRGVIVYLALLGVLLLVGRGLPKRAFFALRPGAWPRALGLALTGYVGIFVGAGLLLVALDAGDEQGLTPEEWDSSRAGAYAANFVAIALVGPVVEELLYRGAGMTPLARWHARRRARHRHRLRARPRARARARGTRLLRARHGLATAADGQRLPVHPRPLRVQRHQPDRRRRRLTRGVASDPWPEPTTL